MDTAAVNKGFFGRFSARGVEFGGFIVGDKVYEARAGELGPVHSLSDLTYLPPSIPSKIVCVGLNHGGHAKDIGRPLPPEPLLFLKANNALAAHEEEVIYPPITKSIFSEGELVIVIGKEAINVSEEESLNYVLGYTCGNDLAARDLQNRDGQWMRSKSLNGFAPIGPAVLMGDIDPDNLNLVTRVNGKVYQEFNTSELAYGCRKLISYTSKMMPLYPGDIIMTGTPSGSPEVKAGDVMEIEIEGIGVLRNKVVSPK